MRKFATVLLLVTLLMLVVSSTVLAAQGTPGDRCPDNFHLHDVHEMMDGHTHIGTSTDRNGNGFICAKHITETLHLHIDDNAKGQ